MARLRIATNSQWRDSSGERHEQSEFHSVVAFDKLAQIAVQYCTKGRQVYVEGKLRSRDYTDADGTRRFVTEVIAETIKLLGAPARSETTPADVVADSPALAPAAAHHEQGAGVSARPSDLLSEEFRVHPEGFWSTAHLLGDDGYDRMTTAAQRGWNAVAACGGQGWDLGECPYAVIFHRTRDGAYELAENVEGDVTMYSYPTRALRDRATDAMAFFHWRLHDEEWVTGLANAEDMPATLCGPFSRERGDG